MEDERKQGPAKQAPSKQGRGNFAQDRERAAEAGRKGGESAQTNRSNGGGASDAQ